MPNLRLIPVVVFAAVCLLAIKTIDLAGDGRPAAPGGDRYGIWKQLTGGALDQDDLLITGATPEAKPEAEQKKPMAALPNDLPPAMQRADATKGQSDSERLLIERLQERRQELEARERDLEMRENLIKAAEQQLDSRIDELKELEGKGGKASPQVKSIVTMYETMGPKEAARIFDRMESRTLVELAKQMNPRKLAEIMAKMDPEAAERLTVELARHKPAADQTLPATDLKRIEAKNAR